MAYLVLVRHGQSEDNARGLWCGWRNPSLTEKGREEARTVGDLIKDIPFDYVFVSDLLRSQQTWDEMKPNLHTENIQKTTTSALKERNYGDYAGKNKWEIKEDIGEEEFQRIRRSWDYQIPNGESLKQVYARVIPYYESTILPLLKEDKNVLLSIHGNSMRALVKYLDSIADNDISTLEIATGVPYIYQIDEKGKVVSKEIRGERENTV